MTQLFSLLISFGIGAALGIAYFAGLWYTVKHLPDARHPSLSLVGSFLTRLSFLLAGFALLMNGGLESLAAALLGFLVAREILVRRMGRHG